MPDLPSTEFDFSPGPGAPGMVAGPEQSRGPNFEDPSYQWRRLFAEALGTFLLVLVAVGGDVVGTITGVPPSREAAATAPALVVMAVILFMGRVSGAHINPVVSIAFAPPRRVSVASHSRLLSCATGRRDSGMCLSVGDIRPARAVRGDHPGLHRQRHAGDACRGGSDARAGEHHLGTASSAQNVGPLSALAVGGYIALAGLWAGPVSGASMNPVRSFAPALVRGDLAHYWIYLAGPLIGALVAVAFAYLLRGRGGDRVATRAAQGDSAGRESEEEVVPVNDHYVGGGPAPESAPSERDRHRTGG